MAIALAPGAGVFSEFQFVRRVGRSAQCETWLVHKADETQQAVKLVVDGAAMPGYSRITMHRHPFLMNWERCEVMDGDLLLLRDWSEETLEDYLGVPKREDQEELTRSILLRHLEETAEVLDFLHKKVQLVHGAVKPSNIGLLHNHVKLLDWGLLNNDRLRGKAWSPTELMMSAPEQLRGELSPQCDQYALACIFVKALTGQPPRSYQSLEDYFQSSNQDDQLDSEDLSTEDRKIITRALHHDPALRFKSCQEFIRALAQNPVATPARFGERIIIPGESTKTTSSAKKREPVEVKQTIELLASKPPSEPEIPTTIIKSFVKADGKTGEKHPDSSFLNLNNLVYHSQVASCGILTPSLVLGLGGQGVAVLQQLADQVHKKFGNLHDLPNLRLLAIDTDADGLPENKDSKPGTLGKEQAYHCRLVTPGGYLWKDLGLQKAANWIPSEHLDRLGPEPKTSQLRSLGRLALVASYPSLRERMTSECKAVLQSRALMEATKNTGLPVRQDITPTIYLVAGIGGATGGGALVDLAYLARSVLADLGWSQVRLTGVVFLPADSDDDWVKANAFASIVELNHFTEESFFRAQYGSTHDHLHMTQRPFDEVFFWRLPSATAVEEISNSQRRAANWLVRDVTTPLGSLRLASRELVSSEQIGEETPWRSNGLSSLHAIRELLQRRGKRSVLGQFIQRWIAPPQEIIDEVQKDGERFLQDNHFTIETVLARFEHVVAIVLGREPVEFIDEWISPLRKGAAARPPLETVAQDILQKVELYFGHGEGYQPAPAILAIQQEAETAAQEICGHIPMLLKGYLDRPGYRLGASLTLARMLLQWVTAHLTELQKNHVTIEQDMIRAERTLTQMVSQEERAFALMGRQRQVSQVVQDLMDYPARVIREEMFARGVAVFQKVKDTITNCLAALEPGEQTLLELRDGYLEKTNDPEPPATRLLLDGQRTLADRIHQLHEELPHDAFTKLDVDFSQCLTRYQANYTDACQGKGPGFRNLLELLEPSLDDLLLEILPPEDATEQLLRSPSLAVVEQLREAYRDARPPIPQASRSRQGAFCLMVTPGTDSAKELLNMAQSTLPQIIAAAEGFMDEVFLYRETGPLYAEDIYPQGQKAYQLLLQSPETWPHSRMDISSWHSLSRPHPSKHEMSEEKMPCATIQGE